MRTTDRGLSPNTYIRVRNASSRKHAHGMFIRVLPDGARIEYRSAYNGGVYHAALADVAVDRQIEKRLRTRGAA